MGRGRIQPWDGELQVDGEIPGRWDLWQRRVWEMVDVVKTKEWCSICENVYDREMNVWIAGAMVMADMRKPYGS